jgi:hypothetical protein
MELPSYKNIEVFQASISKRFMIFHTGCKPGISKPGTTFRGIYNSMIKQPGGLRYILTFRNRQILASFQALKLATHTMELPSYKNIEVFQASISKRFMIFHTGCKPGISKPGTTFRGIYGSMVKQPEGRR